MIDLHKLKVFQAVVQAGSFSAAAERLYITQSAVSQHIKELEAGLGQSLFQRGRRGVRLTPQGESLAGYTRQIFELVAQAESALTRVEALDSGRIRIGATPGVGVYLMPGWVQRFRARYPNLTVALQTGVTAQILADARAQRLDIGVIEGELDDSRPARLRHLVLQEIEQQIVVGPNHPLWGQSVVDLDDLRQHVFIVREPGSQSRIWLEQTLRQRNIEPRIGAEFDNLESMKRAITAGTCLAVLPLYVVKTEAEQGQLYLVPVAERALTRSLKLIWNPEQPMSPIARAFLGELSHHFPALEAALRQDAVFAT